MGEHPYMISSGAWWVDPRTLGANRARRKRKASLLRICVLTLAVAITAFMVFVVVLHNRNTWWTYNLQSEGTAKETVEGYLTSLQTDHRFSNARAVNKSGVLLTGLSQYQYVATLYKKRIETQYSFVSQPAEMGLLQKFLTFETYDTYVSNLEHLYEWQLMQGGLPRQTVIKLHDYNYGLLYDAVLINQFGEQSAKQFLFDVHPTFASNPAFTITALSEVR